MAKSKVSRTNLSLPNEGKKLLMHTCCAPCVGDIMERLVDSDVPFTLYFYNPNIHPTKEYELRKNENKRFADKLNIEFIDADYDKDRWFDLAKGMELEPERGIRCTMCFDMRFEKTAWYASLNGFDVISSSLGISRWKNLEVINQCGVHAASKYPGIDYWTFNWRKQGGSAKMLEVSKKERFYKQEYCGCVYSLRDTNQWRKANGRPGIRIGQEYYEPNNEDQSQS